MDEKHAFESHFLAEHGVDLAMQEKCRKYWQAALEWRDSQTARPQFVAEGYMVATNGKKLYFDTYAEANSNCVDDQRPTILYDILQKPTQTG